MARGQGCCMTEPSHNILFTFHWVFPPHHSGRLPTFCHDRLVYRTAENILSPGQDLVQIVADCIGFGSYCSLYCDLAGPDICYQQAKSYVISNYCGVIAALWSTWYGYCWIITKETGSFHPTIDNSGPVEGSPLRECSCSYQVYCSFL